MSIFSIHISKRQSLLLFLAVVGLIEGLIAMQGVSMYDEGACLTSYQYVFSYPESCEYFFMYYNGLICGGLWEQLFGQYGYYGYRIANVLVILATIAVCYAILRRNIPQWIIFLGISIHLLASDYGVVVLHHNWISALLIVMSIYFLLRAVNENEDTGKPQQAMLLAGFFIGINIFTRLPNICLVGLFLILVPHFLYNRSKRGTLVLLSRGLMGVIGGIVIEILFISVCGHLDVFTDNLRNLFFASSDEFSGHNLYTLLNTYLYAYYRVFRMIFFWYPYDGIYMLYAFSTVMAVIAYWRYRKDKFLIYFLTAALLMAHLHPIGSMGGIAQLGDNSLWLLIPCSIAISMRLIKELPGCQVAGKIILYILLSVYVIRQTVALCHTCDFDNGPRWEKTWLVNNPKMNTYTQKRYKEELDIIIHELRRYVKPGDVLLCWENLPLVHYITGTRPFLSSPWVSCIPESNIHAAYVKAEKTNKNMPVLLVGKGEPHDFTLADRDWNNASAEQTIDHQNKKINEMLLFQKRHNYKVVWENELFQILLPQ